MRNKKLMFGFVFLFLILSSTSVLSAENIIFEDDFDRADSSTIGGDWTQYDYTGTWQGIENNLLKLNDVTSSKSSIAYVLNSEGYQFYEDAEVSFDFKVTDNTQGGFLKLNSNTASNHIYMLF